MRPRVALAVLLVAVLVLAGCAGPGEPSPEAVALQASRDLVTDLGAEGRIKGTTTEVVVAGAFALDARVEQRLHGDARSSTVHFVRLVVFGQDRTSEVRDARIQVLCTPERVVYIATGLSRMGEQDRSLEIANPVGTCRAHADELAHAEDAFRPLTERLGTIGRTAFGFVAQGAVVPEYRLVAATPQGGAIEAVYDVEMADRTYRANATIEDKRIVAEKAVIAMQGMEVRVATTYHYGVREAAPAWRGTERL